MALGEGCGSRHQNMHHVREGDGTIMAVEVRHHAAGENVPDAGGVCPVARNQPAPVLAAEAWKKSASCGMRHSFCPVARGILEI